MPLEREKILVDNLLVCLNLYHTSLVWALTAALAFFLAQTQQVCYQGQ